MKVVRVVSKKFKGYSEYTVISDALNLLNGYPPYKVIVRHLVSLRDDYLDTDWTPCTCIDFPNGDSEDELFALVVSRISLDGQQYKIVER